MKAENILEVRDLQTTFTLYEGLLKAVNHVDLTVRTGKTLGIIGESGCGKSVTAHSILNTVQTPGKVEGGSVFYRTREGKEVDLAAQGSNSKFMRSIRGKEISMIFQEPMTSMSPVYTIGQQMTEAYLTHQPKVNRGVKKEAEERAIEMLTHVGMQNPKQRMKDYPHQLSGGMCQRAMIAMALMLDPAILIADEPTTALDVTVQAQITNLMLELQKSMDMSIIYITHDMGVISEVADDICVMYLGRVMEQGTSEQIFLNPTHPYTIRLLRSIPKLGKKIPGARLDTISGNVPVPIDPKEECGFYSRCLEAEKGLCDQGVPDFVEVEPGHYVRCFLHQKGAV
ncbi:MAG: ABC transporter ATP-binding protein [Clostridiales bacterium]|nr:ABC transporter ATP-binding protein [Clostridiales bacterium]